MPCEDGKSHHGDFFTGVGIALLGSTIIPLGMNLQRAAHLRQAAEGRETNVLCDRLWLIGLAIFALGNVADGMALSFAPQSVITPVDGWSLVANLFTSSLLLKEVIGGRTLLGSVIIIIGILVIVLPGSVTSDCDNDDLDRLLQRWERQPFIIFASFHLALLVAVLRVVLVLERRMNRNARVLACTSTSSDLGGSCDGTPAAHAQEALAPNGGARPSAGGS